MQKPAEKKPRSRFDLFVKLAPGLVSHFPQQQRTFCFRGDKFTDEHAKQLKNLVKHLVRDLHTYSITELYDNYFTTEQFQKLSLPIEEETDWLDQRIVIKINAGTVEKNRLTDYSEMLKGLSLPNYLK